MFLQAGADDQMVKAIVYASASCSDGTEIVYSTQFRPSEQNVKVLGEVERSNPDGNTDSVFELSKTATEPQQIAQQIRSVASQVCTQCAWLEALVSG